MFRLVGADQPVPLNVNAMVPLSPSATQKVADGHDTEFSDVPESMLDGADQFVPLKVSALPMESTATSSSPPPTPYPTTPPTPSETAPNHPGDCPRDQGFPLPCRPTSATPRWVTRRDRSPRCRGRRRHRTTPTDTTPTLFRRRCWSGPTTSTR